MSAIITSPTLKIIQCYFAVYMSLSLIIATEEKEDIDKLFSPRRLYVFLNCAKIVEEDSITKTYLFDARALHIN